eukprot:GSChrysophyteH1.ASY1.ANO1.947.1 assembled CDS
MPLAIITGHPCSGKTKYVSDLVHYLSETHDCEVVVVNEESLNISKAAGYSSSTAEKVTRAALKSAVDHSLSSAAWVVVDSLNYIKGFRYELHCLARTVKSTQCTIWITSDEHDSDDWSTARNELGQDNYPREILVDLRRRFEPPNERNRWDRPLIRVKNAAESSSFERVYQALSATTSAQPNSSTVAAPHGGANMLYELDRVSQEIVQAVSAHLTGPEGQAGAPMRLPTYDRSFQVHRTVSLAELQRHRLQFVRLNSKHPPNNAVQIGAMFIDFLAVQL